MFLRKEYLFFILLLTAFILRIILAIICLQPSFTENDDLMRYQDWGKISYYHGVSDSYTTRHIAFGRNANNQPPGTAYIDYGMYTVYESIFHTPANTKSNLYSFFLKIPPVVADIITGFLIFIVVRKYTKRKNALIATSLFLFNPVIIYNSAVWGQTDALNNVLFYATLTCFIYRKYFFTFLLFFLSIYIKLSLLPLLPLLLLFVLKEMKWNYVKVGIYTIGSILLLLLMTLPVSLSPLMWLSNFVLHNSAGELQYITNYSFNFWSVLFNPDSFSLVPVSSQIYYGLSLNAWAYIVFALVYIPLLLYTIKIKKLETWHIFGITLVAAFAMYLLLPRMHERYLYPVFPLMATYIGLKMKNYIVFLLLAIINFINLYVVWHPIDFLPTFITGIIVHSKVRLGMSVLMVLLFAFLYIQIFFTKYSQTIANKITEVIMKKKK